MVTVDPLKAYPQKATSGGRYFGSGKQSCHMMADTSEELHAFAARLGLKREWCQKEGTMIEHYDLTPTKRAAAVRLGAVEMSGMDQSRRKVAQWKQQNQA